MEMKTAHIVWFISLCQCLIHLVSEIYISAKMSGMGDLVVPRIKDV